MGKWRERFQQSTGQGASASPEATLPLPASVNVGPESLTVAAMPDAVERAGRLMQWFSLHAHEWPARVYVENAGKLQRRMAQVDDGFRRYRTSPADYGWQVTEGGFWYRSSEEPCERVLSDTEQLIRDTLEQAAVIAEETPHVTPWGCPDVAALEEAMALAREQSDTGALRTAAEAFLILVRQRCRELADGADAEARDLRDSAGRQRAAVVMTFLALGLKLGWPRFPIPGRPGVYIPEGESAWRMNLRAKPDADLFAMAETYRRNEAAAKTPA